MRSTILAIFLVAAVQFSTAAPAPASTQAEIDALLAKLESSGCSFYRNGSWHGASEAQAHLRQKLDYLEKRNAVQTTEQFIERAGSTSSISGKPYLVRCGNQAPVQSKVWLTTELNALRSGPKPGATNAR